MSLLCVVFVSCSLLFIYSPRQSGLSGYYATEELNIPCPLHTHYKMYASDSVLPSIAHTPPPRSIHQLRTGSVSVCMKHAFHMERLYDSNDLRQLELAKSPVPMPLLREFWDIGHVRATTALQCRVCRCAAHACTTGASIIAHCMDTV